LHLPPHVELAPQEVNNERTSTNRVLIFPAAGGRPPRPPWPPLTSIDSTQVSMCVGRADRNSSSANGAERTASDIAR
jgi:hypothetical protein